MRFVAVKSEEAQGAAAVFRVRELLIRQRTQAINTLCGHLAEFGEVVSQGTTDVPCLVALVEDQQVLRPEGMPPGRSAQPSELRTFRSALLGRIRSALTTRPRVA